jgi:hypothetical protein
VLPSSEPSLEIWNPTTHVVVKEGANVLFIFHLEVPRSQHAVSQPPLAIDSKLEPSHYPSSANSVWERSHLERD